MSQHERAINRLELSASATYHSEATSLVRSSCPEATRSVEHASARHAELQQRPRRKPVRLPQLQPKQKSKPRRLPMLKLQPRPHYSPLLSRPWPRSSMRTRRSLVTLFPRKWLRRMVSSSLSLVEYFQRSQLLSRPWTRSSLCMK